MQITSAQLKLTEDLLPVQRGNVTLSKRAPHVLELEQKLARIQWTPTQNRDPQKIYNLFTVARLNETLSNFQVEEMLSVLGYAPDIHLVVWQPWYLEALNKLFVETDVAVWQDYLRMLLLAERAPVLSQAFRDELTAYQQKKGFSAKEIDQWLRAVLFLEKKVDMLYDRVYVEHYFGDDYLEQLTEIVNSIKEECRLAITSSTLFSEAPRKQALDKLEKMRFFLGYLKEWKDYSELEIAPGDLVGNVSRIAQFDHSDMMAKLNWPVDPDEWSASPTKANAFYKPSANKFVLMAAILQPPILRRVME